jgi:hypothetical protein
MKKEKKDSRLTKKEIAELIESRKGKDSAFMNGEYKFGSKKGIKRS